MSTVIDFRAHDARERGNQPEPDAIPFDLSGCESLMTAIRSHADAMRRQADRAETTS